MWGVCVCVEYYSTIKKNKIMPFAATWIDLEIIILSEVNQTKTNTWYTYMWNLKKWYKWTYLQNRNTFSDIEKKLIVTKGEREKSRGLGLKDTH